MTRTLVDHSQANLQSKALVSFLVWPLAEIEIWPGSTSSVVSGLHHAPGTFPRIRQAQATLFRSMTFTYRLPLRATSTTRAAQCARPNSCLSQFSLWMRGPVRASGPDAVWQPIIDCSCKVPKYNTVLQILNPTNINRFLCWQWQSNSKVLNSKYEY